MDEKSGCEKGQYPSEDNQPICLPIQFRRKKPLSLCDGSEAIHLDPTITRQMHKQRRTLCDRLGYLISWMLISVAGFAIYVGQKLLWIAGRIRGSELVTLSVVPFSSSIGGFTDKRSSLTPNDQARRWFLNQDACASIGCS